MSGDGGGGGGGGGGKGGKGGGGGGGFTPPPEGGGGSVPGDSATPPTTVSSGGGGTSVPGDNPFGSGSTGGGGGNVPGDNPFGTGGGSNTLGSGSPGNDLLGGNPGSASLPGTSSFDESGFNSTSPSAFSTSPLSSITNPTGASSPSLAAGPGSSGLPGVGDSKSSGTGGGSANNNQGSSDSILKSLGIINPLGSLVALGGLGSAVAQGNKPVAFTPEMTAQAKNLDTNGVKLMSYLESGTLPPGLQASVDTAKQSARAQIISNFASRGMPTDPAHNSALASALAQADTQATINIATIGQQLLSSGVQESQLASHLYETLAKIDVTQQQQVGQAIANVSAALSRGGGGNTGGNSLIKIG